MTYADLKLPKSPNPTDAPSDARVGGSRVQESRCQFLRCRRVGRSSLRKQMPLNFYRQGFPQRDDPGSQSPQNLRFGLGEFCSAGVLADAIAFKRPTFILPRSKVDTVGIVLVLLRLHMRTSLVQMWWRDAQDAKPLLAGGERQRRANPDRGRPARPSDSHQIRTRNRCLLCRFAQTAPGNHGHLKKKRTVFRLGCGFGASIPRIPPLSGRL